MTISLRRELKLLVEELALNTKSEQTRSTVRILSIIQAVEDDVVSPSRRIGFVIWLGIGQSANALGLQDGKASCTRWKHTYGLMTCVSVLATVFLTSVFVCSKSDNSTTNDGWAPAVDACDGEAESSCAGTSSEFFAVCLDQDEPAVADDLDSV